MYNEPDEMLFPEDIQCDNPIDEDFEPFDNDGFDDNDRFDESDRDSWEMHQLDADNEW